MQYRALMRLGALILSALAASCSATPTGGGATALDVTGLRLTDQLGEVHDIPALLESGQVVSLVFWQTWCHSCKAEGPALAAAARRYAGRIHFLGVVSGGDDYVDTDEVARVSEQLQLPYGQYRDKDGRLAVRCAVRSTPTLLVLGRGGRILYTGRDLPGDWDRLLGT